MDFDDNDDGQRDVLDDKLLAGFAVLKSGVLIDDLGDSSRELIDLGYITAPQEVRGTSQQDYFPGTHMIVDEKDLHKYV
jgi:hypothetical protein